MLDRVDEYRSCLAEPDQWAIATVARVSGSVPRPIGTSMAVRADGTTIGSVSAGCVEGAVVEAAMTAIGTGRAAVESYGYGDDDGLSVGLMCGGNLEVLVQPVTQLEPALRALLDEQRDRPRSALLRPLRGPQTQCPVVVDLDSVTAEQLDREIGPGAGALLEQVRHGGSGVLDIRETGGPTCNVIQQVLAQSRRARPRLVIYGSNDYAAALCSAAALLDRYVVVCDARPVFATAQRHPGADEVVCEHPADHLRDQLLRDRLDSRSAVVVLTHDPRYDLPVLDEVLRASVGYVGAMGSRRTHERRAQELLHGGLPRECLDRLHSPIGLNIGARTPAEVAVSILSELLAVTSGHRDVEDIVPLRATTGSVHGARRVREAVR